MGQIIYTVGRGRGIDENRKITVNDGSSNNAGMGLAKLRVAGVKLLNITIIMNRTYDMQSVLYLSCDAAGQHPAGPV